MNATETEAWITEQLVNGVPQEDIVLRLTQKTGLYWPDAEALVRETASRNVEKIERKQAPLVIALALFLFLGGIGVILLGLSPFMLVFTGERAMPVNLTTLIMLFAQTGSGSFWLMMTGAGMVFGSLIGMRRVWSNFLNR